MCSGKDCGASKYCYRAKAKPSNFWQSYFVSPPERDTVITLKKGRLKLTLSACKFFWGSRGNKELAWRESKKEKLRLTAADFRRNNGSILWNDI